MRSSKKRLGWGVVSVIVAVILVVGSAVVWKNNSELFREFRSFSVKIVNKSDYDLVSVETGILQSDSSGNAVASGSKDTYDKKIKAGREKAIKPKLRIDGEGGIYLKYTDSRGETVQKTVCSYTEYVSGYSTVTIHNDKVEVQEKCH